MLFNSLDFAIFLPIVFALYWLIPNKQIKWQNALILIASYVFYGWWDWRFLSLIAFSTLVDFVAGLQIERSVGRHKKRSWLLLSILVNLGFLGFFKYYNFFVDNLINTFTFFGQPLSLQSLNIILPVGISFYTFQTLSYSIDVYRGKLKPTNDIVAFAAYVSFFPQLVAGPIERAIHLLPQFKKERTLNLKAFQIALNLILIGLFKKVVVADRLGPYVTAVFSNYETTVWIPMVIGVLFFAIQIYCDFSGYSDIAIGVARLFGFDLMLNFHTPYFATSFSNFWQRWHISLSSWFKDYLYIPMGGNRVSPWRHKINLFTTFLVSGLWHGANWTFVVWGALHGFILVVENSLNKIKLIKSFNSTRLSSLIKMPLVFAIVCLTWVFFRSESISQALFIISRIFSPSFNINLVQLCVGIGPLNLVLSFLVIGFLLIIDTFYPPIKAATTVNKFQTSIATVLIILIVFLGKSSGAEFIYFQF